MLAEIEIRRAWPNAFFSFLSSLSLPLSLFYTANYTDRKALVHHLKLFPLHRAVFYAVPSLFWSFVYARAVAVTTTTLIGNFFVRARKVYAE